MNVSFAGCGFLSIYHVGVACCFRKNAPHLLLNKILGASAGAIAACCLICDMPLGEITSDVLRVATQARSRSLGPFNPKFNIHKLLLEGLEKTLPRDAHLRVNGKLHISLTRARDGKNVIVSDFHSRDELIQALLASAFIPIFSGLVPPKFRGTRYMDGGYSDNLPTLDENTITVSPFCGESDICPRDDSSQLFHINVANTSIEISKHNMYRLMRILFPPKPEVLSNMCKQGFDDALRFLHRNNLINCMRCLAVQSTFTISKMDDNVEFDPQCQDCNEHIKEALVSNVPDTVMNIFQEAIDAANKGLLNWVFKHRGMKLLSVLTLPYTLPIDFVYATLLNLMGVAPHMGSYMWEMSKQCVDQIVNLLHKINVQRKQHNAAKVGYKLALTEYGGVDIEACPDEPSTENKTNMDFTLSLNDSGQEPITEEEEEAPIPQLPRNASFTLNKIDPVDVDTFEHIYKVTAHHEAIMAFYYLDDNNKVKVTELYDVTDSDSPIVQTRHERELNQKLEYDDEWSESAWTANQRLREDLYLENRHNSLEETEEVLSEFSLEDILDRESTNLFSDPESEWNLTYKIEEPDDDDDDDRADDNDSSISSGTSLTSSKLDLRPESDQPLVSNNNNNNNNNSSISEHSSRNASNNNDKSYVITME